MSRSLPADPLIRQLVQQSRAAQMSRRALLAGATGGAAALALAACAPGSSEGPSAATDVSDSEKIVRWANWALYLDEDDDGNYPTLQRFIAESGIEATYNVEIDDNNTYYGRIKDQLALGQDVGADVVCLTDWMISRLIRFGYAQELDHGNIPNLANLNGALRDPDFDPGRAYSVPWQGGFGGICWDVERFPNGFESVSDLWNEPQMKGKLTVLSEMRDTIGVIMLEQGVDISGDFTEADFMKALDVFREQIESGQIGTVKGNSYIEDLQNGDAWGGIVWSGDVMALNAEIGYDKFAFALPTGGATLWNDNFLVPIGATHKANAEKLIDFYYQPDVAAEVAAWVNYITPVDGAREAMEEFAPELVDNQLIFPDDSTLANAKMFRTLTPAEEQSFGNAFQSVLLGA